MADTCTITSTSSSVLSNDRSSQRTATYISAKTDTPGRAVSLRQLIYLYCVLSSKPVLGENGDHLLMYGVEHVCFNVVDKFSQRQQMTVKRVGKISLRQIIT